jgi:hypothetical protein
MRRYFSIAIVSIFLGCKAPSADIADYTNFVITKVCDLPAETYETSGIIFFQGLLWTINDSGNEPILYGVDTASGALVRKLYIDNAVNTDWEAIVQDDKNIYIADNGNNFKTRNSYLIYVIKKDSITDLAEQRILPFQQITYTFSDFDLAKINLNKTSVDSEAILVDGDSIFIYIKDWLFSELSVFSIPISAENAQANLRGSYQLGFAATAATIIGDNQIAFLGYKDYHSYLCVLKTNHQLYNIKEELANFELIDMKGFQTEGMTYKDGKLYISCENSVIPQALFRLDFK